MKYNRFLILSFCLIFTSSLVFGHGTKKHPKLPPVKNVVKKAGVQSNIQNINLKYKELVKPIFKNKCLDCHGNVVSLPWYYSLPIAKQLINSDILDAQKHLDMRNDFPFGGHGNSKADLEAISKSLIENSMPPFQYQLMHKNTELTAKEKNIINAWIKSSLTTLSKGHNE